MATSKLIIVGDLFPFKSNFDLFAKGDIKALFGDEICKLFSRADYRICNLEGALTDGNDRCVTVSYVRPYRGASGRWHRVQATASRRSEPG